MLEYCQLDHEKQTAVNFSYNLIHEKAAENVFETAAILSRPQYIARLGRTDIKSPTPTGSTYKFYG